MTSDPKLVICLPIDCEGSLAWVYLQMFVLLTFNVMWDVFYSFYFFGKVQDRRVFLNNYFCYCCEH